jgi:hypothetical protein
MLGIGQTDDFRTLSDDVTILEYIPVAGGRGLDPTLSRHLMFNENIEDLRHLYELDRIDKRRDHGFENCLSNQFP